MDTILKAVFNILNIYCAFRGKNQNEIQLNKETLGQKCDDDDDNEDNDNNNYYYYD
jgi:hypothetical protein